MQNIDILERGRGGPMRIVVRGERFLLPDPADIDFQMVLLILREKHIPGTPNMPEWQRARVFDRWAAHYDLPDFDSARRLAYLVDHYRSGLTYDLRSMLGCDLGELWRARRWRTLLDLIDHLPGHSWYAASVAMDEEHAKMLAESLAARQAAGEDVEKAGPSLVGWTPEVSQLANILDAVRHVAYSVVAVQIGKEAGQPPAPSPRPVTPLERELKRAEQARRKAAHDAIVARVLPKKRRKPDAVD